MIIPTYNEAKNLSLLFEEIWQTIDKSKIDLEFIVVDDNSPDGTGQTAEDLAGQYPIKVIHRSGKLGLGSAVIAGFKASNRPYLGVMDADLSHDPIILNDLILALENGYDITVGSRFKKGSVVEDRSVIRRMISGTGVLLTFMLTGVKDPLSGYFFFNRKILDNVELKTVGYKILFEILVKGNYDKVKEMAYTFRMRRHNISKLNYKEYWLFIKQIIAYSLIKVIKKIF